MWAGVTLVPSEQSRKFANSINVVNATGGTWRNFAVNKRATPVWRQVVGEIDVVAIGQVMFQSKLIGGGINYPEVVDAGVCGVEVMRTNKVWNGNRNEQPKETIK